MTHNEAKEKVRENRLRRVLSRRGYTLMKTRRRDPQALDYGCYAISEAATDFIIAGYDPKFRLFCFNLNDVEAWVKKEAKRGARIAEANSNVFHLFKMSRKDKAETKRLIRQSLPQYQTGRGCKDEKN